MFIFGYFLKALAEVLNFVLMFYMWIIVARAVLSWVNPDPYNPIVRFIHNVTEPVLVQIRRKIPAFLGGIDFTPMIAILGVVFLRTFLVNSLLRMAATLV